VSEITIPSLGVGMTEALLVRWLKEPGDAIEQDEPVAEIETDKTTMDLVSPSAGQLGPHLHEPGAIIAVGDVVVRVLDDEHGAGAHAVPVDEASGEELPSSAPPLGVAAEPGPVPAGARRPHTLSPRARRLAQERAATASPTSESPGPAPAQRSGRFRELIAAKVSESWRTIPHFAVTREVDAEAMQLLLAAWRAEGIAATLTDVLLRALALAHRDQGTNGSVDLGLAVATDGGVVIPVISDVLELTATQLATARLEAVERARGGRLDANDLNETPVSTLSNLGSKGIDSFTGVIALGQPTLLTVGRAIPRFHPGEGGTIAIRSTIIATLNVDHRVLDGADAADLLVAFAQNAEDVNRLGTEGGATA
jgi:pyruvate dehydrogenase E2 component (dihydrolipoamide acetyltransferase)